MRMGLPLRYRYCSVLQVLTIIICYRGKVSSERAQGCVGSQLSLTCPEMKIIWITTVVLGDSYCAWPLSCCIKDSNCIYNANANHTMDVHRRCDGQNNCTVDVLKESIYCGYVGWSNNDFERITFNCTDDPQNDMMNSTDQRSTVDNRDPDSESAEKSHEEPTTNQDNSHYFTSTDGRLTNLYNNTKADDQSDPRPTTNEPNSQMVQDCVGSRLNLTCEEMKVIQITAVVLGDSNCRGASCCIKDDDCTRNANANHTTDVHRRCDNKQSCIVDVLKEKIHCGYLGTWSNNDFERITYICIDDPRNYWTSTDGTLTKLSSNTEAGQATYALPVVMVTICLIILLAIVVIVVVLYRRKKRTPMELFDPVAMTDVDNRQNESDISANRTQETSLPENNDPLPLYTLIDEADFPKTDGDPVVYSEVELRETVWNDGQSDKSKAATEAHIAGPDGVKDLVNNGDCFPDHSYSLMSHDMADINVNEPLVESYTRLLTEVVSKTSSPEDDEGLTVIENDLYSH